MIVVGRVQRVGFRYYCLMQASQVGVSGWAKNKRDGTVEIEAHGEDEAIRRFVELIWEGPRFSRVSEVKVTPLTYDAKVHGFEIRH